MSHDFARSHRLKREASRRKPARTSGGIPSWLWLLVGTLAGCLIMFLVYLSGVAPALPNLKAAQPAAVDGTVPAASSKATEPAAPPKRVSPVFEFYTKLPEGGQQPITDIPPATQPAPATPAASTVPANPDPIQQLLAEKEAAAAQPAAAAIPADTRPATATAPDGKPATAVPAAEPKPAAAGKGRYLQAGAFRGKAEVDKLRAKISLLGQPSSVQTVTNAKGETLYKVMVGPFRSAGEMDDAKIILGGNGINSIPVGK